MIHRYRIFIVPLVVLATTLGYSRSIGMYVIEGKLNVHERPSHSSSVIRSLEAGWFVVYRAERVDKNLGTNRLGDWIYLDTGTYKDRAKGEEILFGWVRKRGVANPEDFERVTAFESFRVSGWVVDSYHDFTFFKDGTYVRHDWEGRKVERGNVYRKGRVFMARDATPTDSKRYRFSLFTLDDEGHYVFPYGEPGEEMVRVKSEIHSSSGVRFILTGDNVNVREWPSTEARVLTRLRMGARVRLLQRSTNTHTVGDRTGFWAQVDTGVRAPDGDTIRGWMVDVFLREARE